MTGFEPMFPIEEEHEGLVEEEIEGLADIDPSRTDGQHEQDSWRGVAVEDVDDVTGTLAGFLRKRSRKLLGLILRPHVKSLVWAGFLIGIRTLCVLAGPLLVEVGIDDGIPPLLPRRKRRQDDDHRGGRRLPGRHRGERGDVQPVLPRDGTRRPGHPPRPAQPRLRPLPEAQPLVPRALHLGPRPVSAQ